MCALPARFQLGPLAGRWLLYPTWRDAQRPGTLYDGTKVTATDYTELVMEVAAEFFSPQVLPTFTPQRRHNQHARAPAGNPHPQPSGAARGGRRQAEDNTAVEGGPW